MTDWDDLAGWYASEVETDLSYHDTVLPMFDRLMEEGPIDPPAIVVDLGCGEGAALRRMRKTHKGRGPLRLVGCDVSMVLLEAAKAAAPVVRCFLPDLSWLRSGSVDAAFSIYVLDLIAATDVFFAESARVVRPGGSLTVILNHPLFTAPDSAPLLDDDGEILWRFGTYFSPGPSPTQAGDTPIMLQHRPVSALLSAAAAAGWSLRAMEEHPLSVGFIAAEPGYRGQERIPRFLGARWERLGTR